MINLYDKVMILKSVEAKGVCVGSESQKPCKRCDDARLIGLIRECRLRLMEEKI
jgi:hypothetical protein